MRQLTDAGADVTLQRSYTPYGEILRASGTGKTNYAFTGESFDPQTGLTYLRARYYSAGQGRFINQDTWAGDARQPLSYNRWAYGYDNPVRFVDPSGYTSVTINGKTINCPIGEWDCEAVKNVAKLKQAFLGSASRHNKIPLMDDNGFAGLIAATIVSERRIGNVPPNSDPRNRKSQMLEDVLASLGCTVSVA